MIKFQKYQNQNIYCSGKISFLDNILGMWKPLILSRIKYEERLTDKRVYYKWICNKLLFHKDKIAYTLRKILTNYGYTITINKRVNQLGCQVLYLLYTIFFITKSFVCWACFFVVKTIMQCLNIESKYLWINIYLTRTFSLSTI